MNLPVLSLPGRDKPGHTMGGIKNPNVWTGGWPGRDRTGRQAIPVAAQVIKRGVAVAAPCPPTV